MGACLRSGQGDAGKLLAQAPQAGSRLRVNRMAITPSGDRGRVEQVHRLDLDIETVQRADRLVVITRPD